MDHVIEQNNILVLAFLHRDKSQYAFLKFTT